VSKFASFMLVPKAAMDEDDTSPPREGDIGSTGRGSPLESESVALPVQNLAHDLLGAGVGTFYACHERTALARGQVISQGPAPVVR
jgi:hypothetical protein